MPDVGRTGSEAAALSWPSCWIRNRQRFLHSLISLRRIYFLHSLISLRRIYFLHSLLSLHRIYILRLLISLHRVYCLQSLTNSVAQNLQALSRKEISVFKGRKGKEMNNEKKITPQVIGANIRRIRLKHGETQQKLGALLGYGATTIANYESGYRLPDLETFFQIALHYGASLEDFIQDSEYMESETPEDVHES